MSCSRRSSKKVVKPEQRRELARYIYTIEERGLSELQACQIEAELLQLAERQPRWGYREMID